MVILGFSGDNLLPLEVTCYFPKQSVLYFVMVHPSTLKVTSCECRAEIPFLSKSRAANWVFAETR